METVLLSGTSDLFYLCMSGGGGRYSSPVIRTRVLMLRSAKCIVVVQRLGKNHLAHAVMVFCLPMPWKEGHF